MSEAANPIVTERFLAAFNLLGGKELADQAAREGAHDVIEHGFETRVIKTLADWSALPQSFYIAAVGLSKATLTRQARARQRLSAIASDRVFRIARIMVRAEEVFEDVDIARDWLNRPNQALGGKKPLELLSTDAGTESVEDVLGRIEDGVYS